MSKLDHERLELLARQLWAESPRSKAKTWEKAKRNYWRKKAIPLAVMATERTGICRTLMRACGWMV